MYRVFINNAEVNAFDTVKEAYDFAISIEVGGTNEKYNKGTDLVSFEGDECIETTESYNIED